MLHMPAAHTDGDLIVWFRKSDVVSTGDVFSTVTYPMIDLARGGSVQGILNALNSILDITFPAFNNQGGTLVVPGHGRICNESDVAEYRDMTTIIRDRIQLMIEKGVTLAQVKAAGPTKDYDGVYSTPAWTGEMFIEAIYTDLARARVRDGPALTRRCCGCLRDERPQRFVARAAAIQIRLPTIYQRLFQARCRKGCAREIELPNPEAVDQRHIVR
jgi:hypothetical protein